MSMISLQNSSELEVTILSNHFIDNYMPEANGEFVKVYIYLLRLLAGAPASFSLEHMADRLLCTERDITRALKYWQKEKLMTLSYGADKKLCGIVLHNPAAGTQSEPMYTNLQEDAVSAYTDKAKAADTPAYSDSAQTALDTVYSESGNNAIEAISSSSPERTEELTHGSAALFQDGAALTSDAAALTQNTAALAQDAAAPAQNAAAATAPTYKKLTPDRVKELKQNEDIIQLLYIAEQYLAKTLTPTEMQKILFFYDELKMSTDLIEYLIEYCVSRNHRSMRYIETVALAWTQENITTVEMAKNASARYAKEYYTILKAMGISGRNPVETEITLMNTWMKDYGFDMALIQEACSRTVLQTGQPSFQYADKILTGWKKKNVRNLDDIRVLDAEHKKRRQEKAAERTAAPKTTNRFNNFHQRDYDFAEYEKRLLNQ